MKLLLVEDQEVYARIVISQFLADHVVTLVSGLKDARQCLASETFDALLVDYDLVDGKGDVLVAEIRQKDTDMFVVGVSAREAGNEALLRAGANVICSKGQMHRIGEVLAQAG